MNALVMMLKGTAKVEKIVDTKTRQPTRCIGFVGGSWFGKGKRGKRGRLNVPIETRCFFGWVWKVRLELGTPGKIVEVNVSLPRAPECDAAPEVDDAVDKLPRWSRA